MSDATTIKREDQGDILTLRVSGDLNETFVPEHIWDRVEGRNVVLDLSGVSRISSFGVRQWVKAMRELGTRAQGVLFEQCSHAIVSQLNMIEGFAGPAEILSVQAPMICLKCDEETKAEIDLRNGIPAKFDCLCSSCGGVTELEEDRDTYFLFVNRAKIRMQPNVQGVILKLDKIRGRTPIPITTTPIVSTPKTETPKSGHVGLNASAATAEVEKKPASIFSTPPKAPTTNSKTAPFPSKSKHPTGISIDMDEFSKEIAKIAGAAAAEASSKTTDKVIGKISTRMTESLERMTRDFSTTMAAVVRRAKKAEKALAASSLNVNERWFKVTNEVFLATGFGLLLGLFIGIWLGLMLV